MALKIIGQALCPFCGNPTKVGISRDGEGQAVHLICGPCRIQVQAHKDGRVGRELDKEAITAEMEKSA